MKKNFLSEQYAIRINQQFRQAREQILQQQKDQQKTQPTGKLIMLNFNDEYSMPGYYYRIKEFLEDDDAAKERNKKLKEFDDQENNCNNDYRLPDIFFERVQKELEPRANDKESQKIFWLQQAKLYDIEESDYEQVYRLIEDIYQLKEENLSMDDNPPQDAVFILDDADKKLLQSTKMRKTSAFIEEEGGEEGDKQQEEGELVAKQGDDKQGVANRKASSMSIRKESMGDPIQQNNLNDSGYESEREEIKRKLEQEQIEKELALQEYLDDDQLQQLLEIDSDEDIIYNEKDQIYFLDRNKSPFDDINKIYERRDSLHQEKIDFQKRFQKVIINAYKEKLKRKLFSRVYEDDAGSGDEDDEEDELFKLKKRNSQGSLKNSKTQKVQRKNNQQANNRGSFGKETVPPADQNKKSLFEKDKADKNASAVADKQRTNKVDQDLQKSADKNATPTPLKGSKQLGAEPKNKNEDNQAVPNERDQDIINLLMGNTQIERQNSKRGANMHQTFGQADNLKPAQPSQFMQGSFGNNNGQSQISALKQNKSRALIELLREELKNEEGFTSDDLMDGGLKSLSPQRDNKSAVQTKKLYGQLAERGYGNHEEMKDQSYDYNVPNDRYFYAQQLQEYKKEKKQNFVENLKETLKPKFKKDDMNDISDDEGDYLTDKRKLAKEKRKAAMLKTQKLQEQREKQIKVTDLNEINQKLYGCEDRMSQFGLKSNPQKIQKGNSQDMQFGQTQIFSRSQLPNQMLQSRQVSSLNKQNGMVESYQMGQSIQIGNNQNNPQRQNQQGFPINLQKLQSVNNQQAYQQQQQLYTFLDKQSSQYNQDGKQQQQQQSQPYINQQQQLISPESSFIQNSFMQQLPAENINTARSNYSQFLYSARQDQNQPSSKHDMSNAEQSSDHQQYERACQLLYNDLHNILQILLKDSSKKQDYSQVNLLNQHIQELEDIVNYKNNVTPNFLFMKLKIFRDEKKLKEHIDKMSFYVQ